MTFCFGNSSSDNYLSFDGSSSDWCQQEYLGGLNRSVIDDNFTGAFVYYSWWCFVSSQAGMFLVYFSTPPPYHMDVPERQICSRRPCIHFSLAPDGRWLYCECMCLCMNLFLSIALLQNLVGCLAVYCLHRQLPSKPAS